MTSVDLHSPTTIVSDYQLTGFGRIDDINIEVNCIYTVVIAPIQSMTTDHLGKLISTSTETVVEPVASFQNASQANFYKNQLNHVLSQNETQARATVYATPILAGTLSPVERQSFVAHYIRQNDLYILNDIDYIVSYETNCLISHYIKSASNNIIFERTTRSVIMSFSTNVPISDIETRLYHEDSIPIINKLFNERLIKKLEFTKHDLVSEFPEISSLLMEL